jgi:hypothetical protein
MKSPTPPTIHAEPEHVRRKLAATLARLATGKRFTKAERAEFARMSEAWARTLPKK